MGRFVHVETAWNPFNAQYEECTVGSVRPFFTDEPVRIGDKTYWIDTVDVDGDSTHCRVRAPGGLDTLIVPTEWLGRDMGHSEVHLRAANDRFMLSLVK